MDEKCKHQAIKHAQECVPNECCGLFLKNEKGYEYYKCKNISYEIKAESFVIDPDDYANAEDTGAEIVGIVHSHPQNILEFSEQDKYSCKSIDLPFYLVCPDLDKMIVIQPCEVDA